jgi:hypothetical protein
MVALRAAPIVDRSQEFAVRLLTSMIGLTRLKLLRV